jgi:hypothetical protein
VRKCRNPRDYCLHFLLLFPYRKQNNTVKVGTKLLNKWIGPKLNLL